MKRDRSDVSETEPHVFDQTNGVVDLGANGPDPDTAGTPGRGPVAGIAMLSTQKP